MLNLRGMRLACTPCGGRGSSMRTRELSRAGGGARSALGWQLSARTGKSWWRQAEGRQQEIIADTPLPPVLSLQLWSTSGAAASRPAWPTSGRALSPHNSRWAGTVQHGSGGAGEHEWHARGRSCAVRPCKSRDCCGARCAPGQRRASCATWPTAVPAALVPPLRSPHRAGRPAAVPVQIIHSRMYAQVRLGNG